MTTQAAELAASRPRSMVRAHLTALILAGLAFIVLLAHQFYYLDAVGYDAIDDAYISFRYAYNLAFGHGLVFNPGEQVEGYTNFLWTVLMAPLIKLHLPPGQISLLLGALCALAGLLLVIRHADPQFLLVGALAALMLAADGSYALWSVSGMETALFTLLLLAGATRYWYEMEHDRAWPWSGLLFGLAALTRPEGALVFGLTVFHAAAYRLITRRQLVAWSDIGRILGFSLLFGAHVSFRYLYYGRLLPNTFTAKVEPGSTAELERGWRAFSTFVAIHGGWLALLPIPIGLRAMLQRGSGLRASYCLLILLPYCTYIIAVGGDWSVGRFFAPLLPFAYILAAAGLIAIARWLARTVLNWSAPTGATPSDPWVAASAVLLALLLVLGLFYGSSLNGERALFVDPFNVKQIGRARTAMGLWINEQVAKEVVIAVDAAGQMPYYGNRWFIDMFGLNDTNIADLKTDTVGKGTAGHEKFGLDYVIRIYKPDYIIIYGDLLDAPAYQQYYRKLDVDWTNDPALKKLLNIYAWREQLAEK